METINTIAVFLCGLISGVGVTFAYAIVREMIKEDNTAD